MPVSKASFGAPTGKLIVVVDNYDIFDFLNIEGACLKSQIMFAGVAF